jgi:hypothetical protein
MDGKGNRGRNCLRRLSKYEKILALIFLLLLPLCNPWVRGDGVGYYAFGRALLIEHNLKFEEDWLEGNASFRMGRADAEGRILPGQYTSTGHLANHFSVGPAMLWTPFLIAAHMGVLAYDALGGHVLTNGYSRPYVVAMSLGTALYGFLALWISFQVTRKYLPERWAFLATLGIWFASSLPVYMYFNPSWSHAHSAFAVALFFWYWDRTRHERMTGQWVLLGALAGLMMNVYYPNAIFLLFPLLESLAVYRKAIESPEKAPAVGLFLKNLIFAAVTFVAFAPTLITKKIIFGSYLNFGYTEMWYWNSPALLKVCFSAEHGLFSWTPILVLAIIGFFFLGRADHMLGLYAIVVSAVYLYTIGCYQNWAGVSSFGNRFFVSLTILFVLGLAAFFDFLARAWPERRAAIVSSTAMAVLILWNLGLIFQWGTHLIPARGPISWRDAAYNQVAVVPERAARTLKFYLTRRKQLMGNIEDEDVEHLKSRDSDETK